MLISVEDHVQALGTKVEALQVQSLGKQLEGTWCEAQHALLDLFWCNYCLQLIALRWKKNRDVTLLKHPSSANLQCQNLHKRVHTECFESESFFCL